MMEFTPTAFRLIRIYSLEEAKRLNHNEVLPEHIFLALLREGTGTSVRVLRSLQLDFSQARKQVENYLKETQANKDLLTETPFFSSKLEVVYDKANQESENMGHSYIGTEHILVALYITQPIVRDILSDIGLDVPKLRQSIIDVLTSKNKDMEEVKMSSSHHSSFGNNSSDKPGKTNTFYKTPLLDSFSQDLTILARTDKLDPLIGRDKEIERIIQILSRRTKNNAIIIGDPGVGKTAVVEGLALKIEKGEVPPSLLKKRLLTIDLLSIIAGTKYRGEFEDRLRKIIKEVKKAQNTILFIDEFHTIVGAGAAEGAMDASNILKPELARGGIQVIGATTLAEYRKYIEKDVALDRRFQPILLKEPNEEEAIDILKGLQAKYENFHHVKYAPEALRLSVQLAIKYVNDRFLPDKAIDIIDEAGARINLRQIQKPEELSKIRSQLLQTQEEKEKAVQKDNFEKAAFYRDEIKRLENEILSLEEKWRNTLKQNALKITEKEIAETVAFMTQIPLQQITKDNVQKILDLDKSLKKEIIGQDNAITSVVKAIQRVNAGLHYSKRPMGSFLFLGSTGVGKTQLAKSLAKHIFERKESFKRLDMSEYMEKHTVARLVGAPPGYIGYEEGGLLTEFVRKNPYSLIVFDEIEKAHPDIFNLLLQVLEEGELSDNLGNRVSFNHTIIILTSNLGSEFLESKKKMGFSELDKENQIQARKAYEKESLKKVKEFFRPEFVNRLDSIVIFNTLVEEDIQIITQLLLQDLIKSLKGQNITLSFSKDIIPFLMKKGFQPKYGARSLRRTIQKYIEDPLSLKILEINKGRSKYKPKKVILSLKDEEIFFEMSPSVK